MANTDFYELSSVITDHSNSLCSSLLYSNSRLIRSYFFLSSRIIHLLTKTIPKSGKLAMNRYGNIAI